MRAGAKRSKPAATAVWVVKRFPARGGQRDFEGLPGLFHETAGALQHGEGRMPFIQVTDFRLDAERASSRHPPIPRSSSCLRRNSGPPPYSSLVIPR
jgi:hypothetical protein